MAEGDARFLTTRWSLIQRAGVKSEEQAPALEDLCGAYWYPLYAFARRRGASVEDASDAVQGFFLDLLSRESLAVASEERGRFRNFLLTSFSNYQAKQREKGAALKRGGGKQTISFEREEAERRYSLEGSASSSPEKQFLRAWTLELLEHAREKLAESYRERQQENLFYALQDYLAETAPPPYEAIAHDLGKTVGTIRVALHRMRGRYRKAVRHAIADTLDSSSDEAIETELSELLSALSSTGL